MSTILPTKLPDLGPESRAKDAGRAFRKAGPAERVVPECPYCPGLFADLVTGLDIYPGRHDLAHKRFWRCPQCAARVGCHPAADSPRGGIGDGTVPLGRLANAELRNARTRAHDAFNPLFESGTMRRAQAYAWLARELNMTADECHLGNFDIADCNRVIEAVARRRNP